MSLANPDNCRKCQGSFESYFTWDTANIYPTSWVERKWKPRKFNNSPTQNESIYNWNLEYEKGLEEMRSLYFLGDFAAFLFEFRSEVLCQYERVINNMTPVLRDCLTKDDSVDFSGEMMSQTVFLSYFFLRV